MTSWSPCSRTRAWTSPAGPLLSIENRYEFRHPSNAAARSPCVRPEARYIIPPGSMGRLPLTWDRAVHMVPARRRTGTKVEGRKAALTAIGNTPVCWTTNMNLTVKGKNIDVGEALRTHVAQTLDRGIEKYF